MAASPRFPVASNFPIPSKLTTGNTARDGTGTVVTLFTAGTSDSILLSVNYAALETNSVASVIRFFLNNGSTNATASNNIFLTEVVTPTFTQSDTTVTTILTVNELNNLIIPANYKILATISVSPTNPIICYAIGENF